MTATQTQTTRPGVVTFVAVIAYIQSFLAAVAAVSLLIWRDDIGDFLESQGAGHFNNNQLLSTAIGEIVVAVLLFLVAGGLMRGSKNWRIFVVIVEAIAMALAVYALIAHHTGGYTYRAVFTLGIGIFVIWALYGNKESQDFFEGAP